MGPKDKLIYLVRHGQGYHDLIPHHLNRLILDPALTELGRQQAAGVCESFAHHESIELLCSSPMRRAIQTAQLAFAPAVNRGIRLVAVPQAQEASTNPSDTGRSPDVLREEFDETTLDLGLVHEGWQVHEGANATDPESLRKRATWLKRWLYERPEKVIALVAHGYFLHYLTSDIDDKGVQTSRFWYNCEWRSYDLVGGPDDPCFLETEESSRKRIEDEP